VFTPCASVQQGAMMLGVVPVGAAVGPTLLQVELVPPWNRMLAFASSVSVGGVLGSSCAIRFSTAGVYGASDVTVGELVVDGSLTGSAYGTSDGVVGCTQPAGVVRLLELLPLVVAAPPVLAPADATPAVRNETAATAATATAGSLPGDPGAILLFLRHLVALCN